MDIRHSILVTSLFALSLSGCPKKDDATKEQPAASASAAATGTAAATGAPATPDKDTAPAPGAPGAAGGAKPDAGVVISGNGNTVNAQQGAQGSSLNVKNNKGQTGSVSTTSGGVEIKGASGKSVTIPGVGGMPTANTK